MKSQRTIPWESRIARLAGLVDGEGTIGCYFYHDRGSQSPRYGIWLVNSDKRIIRECKEVYTLIGVEKIYVAEKHYKNTLTKHRCWVVQVNRKEDVKKILQAITPYLISKQEQAEIILDFFEKYPILKKGQKGANHQIYDEMIKKIKLAKRKFLEPVETKR